MNTMIKYKNIVFYYTLPFKVLWSLTFLKWFLKEVSDAHYGYIYLIKKCSKTLKYYYNLKQLFFI